MKSRNKPTKIIGVLNITPDSFSDGGQFLDPQAAIKRALTMIHEGADIIDVGGQSSRPGSEPISPQEELDRVLPVITELKKLVPSHVRLSIDTYHALVAQIALEAGIHMVNSLGGFLFDPSLAQIIRHYNCEIIIYHIKGTPKTMQKTIIYTDIIQEIKEFFKQQIDIGKKHGIEKNKFLLDPGIGFGKSSNHNLEIIRKFEKFSTFDIPLVIGISRKSHLGIILQEKLGIETKPDERLEASLAETAIAVLKGASIIRTHDVKETRKFLAILDELK